MHMVGVSLKDQYSITQIHSNPWIPSFHGFWIKIHGFQWPPSNSLNVRHGRSLGGHGLACHHGGDPDASAWTNKKWGFLRRQQNTTGGFIEAVETMINPDVCCFFFGSSKLPEVKLAVGWKTAEKDNLLLCRSPSFCGWPIYKQLALRNPAFGDCFDPKIWNSRHKRKKQLYTI